MENIPDIPTQTIIVVACVCAVVILALVVVLLYFCCRRREPRKDFEANPPHRRPQTMAVQYPSSGSPHNQSSNSIASGKPYAMVPPSGYHEAVPTSTAQDRYDGSVMSTSLGSKPQVFATSQSSKDPLLASIAGDSGPSEPSSPRRSVSTFGPRDISSDTLRMQMAPRAASSSAINATSSESAIGADNPSMELSMTPLPPDGRPMSPAMNGDSASMVSKPRKVIYEVVV